MKNKKLQKKHFKKIIVVARECKNIPWGLKRCLRLACWLWKVKITRKKTYRRKVMVFTRTCKIIPWGPIICLRLASSLWKMQNYNNKKKSFDKKLSFLHGHARYTLRPQKVPKVCWSVVESAKFWKNLFQRKLWFLSWTWKFIPWGPKKCLRLASGSYKT